MRVRVIGNPDGYLIAAKLLGDVVEVIDMSKTHYQLVSTPWSGSTIHKKYAEIVEDTMTNFEPKSGMTFITLDGRSGLFVGTDKGLVMMVVRKGTGKYETFSTFAPRYLTGDRPYHLQSIYAGMNQHENYGLASNVQHLADTPSSYQKVWNRKKESVRLNDSYTAQIKDGKVFVGCQEISFDAVKELAELIKEEEA